MIDFNELLQYVQDGLFTVEKHRDADLYIFGYHSGPYSKSVTRWNETKRRMRGLIVDSTGKIHSRSFEKFFTFRDSLSENKVLLSEGQVTRLPKEPYRIFEKMDGTLTILYWINDVPYLSTQRSFKSLKAQRATKILHEKYAHTFAHLKRDRSYIFEAIYPESQVLIDYKDQEDLILIGVLDNETGRDLEFEDIGFKIAKDWTDDLKYVKSLKELESINLKDLEGFVIRYDSGFRIKIKFPWYKEAHSLMNKLIQLEFNIDMIENRLKGILSVNANVPDSFKVWERFNKGERPKDIALDFPNAYKFFGIDQWLVDEYAKYLKEKEIQGKETVMPLVNEKLLRNSLIYEASSENIMNNRMLNLKNKYD
jgi:hypothetical protein